MSKPERERSSTSAHNPRRRLGDFGERVAVQHLEARGYRIRERNFRTREGEIDIVAEAGGVVAFVEVRTRRGAALGSAAESVTPAKQRRLLALAEAYAQDRPDLPLERRIDVIALDLAPDGRLLSLRHIEGAVWGD
ncbi:MAG TPA: YraN family protein [Dehalococcoidia bacterium]|nr:YraN family protein [Dehalococcoidia bacterium]